MYPELPFSRFGNEQIFETKNANPAEIPSIFVPSIGSHYNPGVLESKVFPDLMPNLDNAKFAKNVIDVKNSLTSVSFNGPSSLSNARSSIYNSSRRNSPIRTSFARLFPLSQNHTTSNESSATKTMTTPTLENLSTLLATTGSTQTHFFLSKAATFSNR